MEGDLSESSDDGNDSSDFDDVETAGDDVRVDQWGRTRKEFYGTGFVDNDWGGMREEEEEAAELEEEDAVQRQKALSQKSAQHLYDVFGDEETVEQAETITRDATFVWSLSSVKKINKKLVSIIEEYQNRKDLMEVIVEPMEPLMHALPVDSILRKQLLMVIDVYTSYITNLLFYIKLKSTSLEQKKETDDLVDSHPVVEEIARFKKMIGKVDAFLDKNARALKKMTSLVENGQDLSTTNMAKFEKSRKKAAYVAETAASTIATTDDVEQTGSGGEEVQNEDGGKRGALSKIVNNETRQMLKKKKRLRHSKLAHRHKFKKLEYKVMSQTGKMRTETAKYTGEHRGIRAGVIKSIKLKA